ncbi:Uncharacterised protein [Pseudomonas fluorescens]|uniref:TubC N-terminal docking domain-containing protein n=2 Tax=Pseudomonas fluorescens group TaxID=136843 RepID=A0A7Y1QQ43_9PSED|nr:MULTISPECIES: hypothetical protein [Pseudomonas fluorescens group]NNA99302.1 hypothetical protein [Pseudomonas gessardii]SUD33661.1 Uncharacterised protein [Pseudomonas fluorescens]
MSAAELIHRASVAGLEMTVSQDGCLQLRADHPPSDNLLVELAAHKIEIIHALNAANDPMLSSAWLSRVARLLETCPDVLLEEGHLEPHDLAELGRADVVLVADIIRASPAWNHRPQRIEQAAEIHAVVEVKPKHIILTAASASQAWRVADAAQTNHLMSCDECHAATGRYCAAGIDLRQRYNNTPMEASE